jgi:integrase
VLEAATHPILGDELRALRELKRQSASPFVFASERGGPFTPSGFAKLRTRAGEEAGMGFKLHPHMLRHACGYALANKGIDTRTLQAYLGHRSIRAMLRWRRGALRTFGQRVGGTAGPACLDQI